MSWQDYVDKQLVASRCVTKAAIAGHDGNLWAKSEGFEVSNNKKIKKQSEKIPLIFPYFIGYSVRSYARGVCLLARGKRRTL